MDKNKILIDLSESENTKFGREEFAQQSLPQKVFSAVWELESEVNNGGFSQYFANGTESASFVVEALEIIGAPKTGNICRRAIASAFPNGLPSTVEGVQSAAGDFSGGVLDKLDPLNEEFFSYPHDLTDLLFTYVSAHPEEFGPLPKPDGA